MQKKKQKKETDMSINAVVLLLFSEELLLWHFKSLQVSSTFFLSVFVELSLEEEKILKRRSTPNKTDSHRHYGLNVTIAIFILQKMGTWCFAAAFHCEIRFYPSLLQCVDWNLCRLTLFQCENSTHESIYSIALTSWESFFAHGQTHLFAYFFSSLPCSLVYIDKFMDQQCISMRCNFYTSHYQLDVNVWCIV